MGRKKFVKNAAKSLSISIADLEIVPFLKPNDRGIPGREMLKRAKKLGANLGLRHAEYLYEHRWEIPNAWQGPHFHETLLIFPGTVKRNKTGVLQVPCLTHYIGLWGRIFFRDLSGFFHPDGRFVRLRQLLKD